jgi:hypothetical protein
MMQNVAQVFELCWGLRAVGFEEQARKIIEAAEALQASLRVNAAHLSMGQYEVFRAEEAVGVVMLARVEAVRCDGWEV